MDLSARCDLLLELAESLGIRVRREALGGEGGGLCRLRGERILFVDTSADPEARYERTLRSLAALDELEDVYVRPEIRDEIEAHRHRLLGENEQA